MTLEQLIQRAQDVRGYGSAQANIAALRALTEQRVQPATPNKEQQRPGT